MSRPVSLRRNTRFARWVFRYGGQRRVAEALAPRIGFRLTSSAVAHWIAGRRTPRLPIARELIAMSEGRLRLADFGPQPEEEE